MTDFLLHTMLPMVLTALTTLHLSGKLSVVPTIAGIARDILTDPTNKTTKPAEAVSQAITRYFWETVILPAYQRLDDEIQNGKLAPQHPGLLDGMDVTIMPPDGTDKFSPAFPDLANKGPS